MFKLSFFPAYKSWIVFQKYYFSIHPAMSLATLFFLGCVAIAAADFACLCGHGGASNIYPTQASSGTPIGTLGDGECKAISDQMGTISDWMGIKYHHSVAYVQRSDKVVFKRCTGDPSSLDTASVTSGSVNTGPSGVQTTYFPMFTTTGSSMPGNTQLCPQHLYHDTNIDHGMLTYYGGSCYEIVPHMVSWSHAEMNCRQKGGHLVSITSAQENEFLYLYLESNFNHTMWIGLHDRQYEEQFQWSSGEMVNYLNWIPGRQSWQHDVEDCGLMIPSQVLRGAWDDIPCGGDNPMAEQFGEHHTFICEFATSWSSAIVG